MSLDETTIIAGALELTEKTARDAMTPLSETFAVDINDKLNRYVLSPQRKIELWSLDLIELIRGTSYW